MSGNYMCMLAPMLNKLQINNGAIIILSDDTGIKVRHNGILDLPTLHPEARACYMFPHLGKSLLSIASIHHSRGTVIFEKKVVSIK